MLRTGIVHRKSHFKYTLQKSRKKMTIELINPDKNRLTEPVWQKPIPLFHETAKGHPYPLHCLPGIIQNAAASYQQYGKQPLPLRWLTFHWPARRSQTSREIIYWSALFLFTFW